MGKKFIQLYLLAFHAVLSLHAQAPNDDIENRIFLSHDSTFFSQTNGCTVQWECVDESLTGKCIDYHNDQWYEFNSGQNSRLFINVEGQKCRDLRGVQIVVVKGEPCNVATYEVLTCVSLANQDDIYVELDSLEPNQDYLINIDGYLHDFCSFGIEVSSTAEGLPPEQTLDLRTSSSQEDHLIRIDWEIPDSLRNEISEFVLFKRIHPAFKSDFVATVPTVANAYGEYQDTYFFTDSIESNKTYFYTLAARDADGRLQRVDSYKFHDRYVPREPRFVRSITIPLKNIRHKESVTVVIYDYSTMNIIKGQVFTYHKKDPDFLVFATAQVIQKDIFNLLVEVINNTTQTKEEYIYDLFEN
jgi:hypothetical protein